ncbi:MAG: hypothetical protein IJ493_09755 [Clostridia bacterium]|nr:hypothetical protein [Clostridia bacterium]
MSKSSGLSDTALKDEDEERPSRIHIREYMTFENPTEAISGTRRSVQGFAIHGSIGFISYHTGIVAAYDLAAKNPSPIDVFTLGSYNPGEPDNRYTNHANQGMFSSRYYDDGDEFPLLYVTAGNSGDTDELGFISRCAVERITRKNGRFTSECVQTIVYNNNGIEATPYESPGWGWPASFVDSEHGFYYTFSARYRTTAAFLNQYDQNAYIVTKFRLPDIDRHNLTTVLHPTVLRPRDILDQIIFPFDVLFTQGGVLRDGKIYYTFGAGKDPYPDAIRIFDLKKRRIVQRIDLSDCIFKNEEIECIDFYKDHILVNTQACKLYEIELESPL